MRKNFQGTTMEDYQRRNYGEHKIENSKGGPDYTVISKFMTLENKNDLKEFEDYLQKRKSIMEDSLCDLVKVVSKENKGFCSNNYSLEFGFEFYSKNIEQEFKERKEVGDEFGAEEMLSVVFNVVGSLIDSSYLHSELYIPKASSTAT